MWTAVVVVSALIAFSNAQTCGTNEIYTSSCSECEIYCYNDDRTCGTDLKPNCTDGEPQCICSAAGGFARNACQGCSNICSCPNDDVCAGGDCLAGRICVPKQTCVRGSPLNYADCVPYTSTTSSSTGTYIPEPDACDGFDCPCGTTCTTLWANNFDPTCVNYGACGMGISNCTAGQLCQDEGMSYGTPPNCLYEYTCTNMTTEPTEPIPDECEAELEVSTTQQAIVCPRYMVLANCNLCSKQCGEAFTSSWECNQTCQDEAYCQCPQNGYSLLGGECIPEFFCPPVTTTAPDCEDLTESTDVPSVPSTTTIFSNEPTTTLPPTTTTPATGNCSNYAALFQLNNDHSIVVDSLYTACATYNGTQCSNFKPYIGRFDNGVVRNSTITSDLQKLSSFTYIVAQYCGTNQLRLYFIMGSRMSNGWGNVQKLCDCNRQLG